MSKIPWIKFYAGDFLNGVADLSPNEIAVYTIVLMRIYDEDGPIPHDIKKIARRCNMRIPQCTAALDSLAGTNKIITENGLIDNERAVKERQKRLEMSAKQSSNISLRWQQEAKKANKINGSAVPPNVFGITKPIPTSTISHKPRANKKEKEDNSEFDSWWLEVPKKVGKGQARKAYATARKQAEPEALLEGIQQYAAETRGADPEYIRHPTTWLNGEGWLDEPVSNKIDWSGMDDPD